MTDAQALLSENTHEVDSQMPNPDASTGSQALPWWNATNNSSRIHDTIWTLVFIASNAVVLKDAIVNLASGTISSRNDLLNILSDLSASIVVALVSCIMLSAGFGYAWIKLMSQPHATSNIIGISFSLNVIFWSLLGLEASANEAWYPALIALFCCAAYALFYVFMRHRLDFTYALLDFATDGLKKSEYVKAVVGAQLALLLYQVIWLSAISGAESPFYFLFLLLNLIWATSIAITFVYIVSGSCLASTLLQGNPVFSSRSAECKFSFGSICFGSLVLALIQTLRTLAHASLQSGAPGSCLALCIFGVLEYLANFLIRCTFSYIAIWGIELSSAVERTSTLLRSRAIDVFVNNNFAGSIVMATTQIGGFFGAFFGCLIYAILGGHSQMVSVALASFTIGSSMTLLVATIVEGMIDSLMVLWIEAPDVLTAYQSRFDRIGIHRDGSPGRQTRLERLLAASRNFRRPSHPDSLI